METKHDAIIAIDDDGEAFVVRVLTENMGVIESLSYIQDTPYDGQYPAGLYYASVGFRYCGGDSCRGTFDCDCGEDYLKGITPIYQLPEVE